MMTIQSNLNRNQIGSFCCDDIVPKNHLVRKIDFAIDFSFIYNEVKDLYSTIGRPSIDPVVLMKIILIQHLFGIKSTRQTIKEIQVNMAYRWFLGFSPTDRIPHFSDFSKNYERRFKGTDIFEKIFNKILSEAITLNYINSTEVFIDSTHIKASANKKKYIKETVAVIVKSYKKELEKEINEDRLSHRKKIIDFQKKNKTQTKEVVKSTTDPDSGMFYKTDKEKSFAYKAHVACDRNNFVLGFVTTSGNVHDSIVFDELLDKTLDIAKDVKTVAVDAGYKTVQICKSIIDKKLIPLMPYKRKACKKDYLKKHEYFYDEYYDCYICPNEEILEYSTTDKDGYRIYKSTKEKCENCSFKNQCTSSKYKTLTRHIWEDYLEAAEHIRHTDYHKETYKERSKTIERLFADGKEKHGLRYTQVRGKVRVNIELLLKFACMNLKKLSVWKWRDYWIEYYKCENVA